MKKIWNKFTFPNTNYILKEIIVAVTIAAFVVHKFYLVLLNRATFIYPGDTADITYSGYHFIANSLKHGIFPLWDPHIFGGIPLAGYPQHSLYYPLNILFWLFPYPSDVFPYYAYHLIVILHIFLMGWFMYMLGRSLRFNRLVSLSMGLVYMFSPNILIFLGWGNQITAFAWFPLVFLFLQKSIEYRRIIYSIVAGFFLGILILAAPAQPAIQGLFLIACFFISNILYFSLRRQNLLENLIFITKAHFITLILGILIGSIALLPIIEFIPRSIRFLGVDGHVVGKDKIPFKAFFTYKSEWKHLLGFLFTSLANTPMAFNFYGAIAFVLSLFGLVKFYFKKNEVFFLLLLSIFSLLYAVGLIFPYFFYNIPFLNLIREPNKYLFFLSFSISVLSGYGLHYIYGILSQRLEKRNIQLKYCLIIFTCLLFLIFIILRFVKLDYLSFQYLSFVFFICTFLYFFGANKKIFILGQVIIVLIIYMDLSQFSINIMNKKMFDIHHYLQSQFKLSSFVPKGVDQFRVAGIESEHGWPYAFNAGDLVGFYDDFGYGSPLYYKYMEYRTRNGYCGKFYDILNTKYLITYPESDNRITSCGGDTLKVRTILGIDHIDYNKQPQNQSNIVFLYENTGRLGYAWVVDDVLNAGTDDMVDTMNDKVDIHSQALISLGNPYDRVKNEIKKDELVKLAYTTKLTSYAPNVVKLNVKTNKNSYLVTSDLYYPGWNVYVNGNKEELYETDNILRGVLIHKGNSSVEYRFEPEPLYKGLQFALFALIISFVYVFSLLFKNRRLNIYRDIIYIVCLLVAFILLFYYIPLLQNITIKAKI